MPENYRETPNCENRGLDGHIPQGTVADPARKLLINQGWNGFSRHLLTRIITAFQQPPDHPSGKLLSKIVSPRVSNHSAAS